MTAAVRRSAAVSEEDNGEDAASCEVLIDQTQDDGIEAIRPGASQYDCDQHKGIKRLR